MFRLNFVFIFGLLLPHLAYSKTILHADGITAPYELINDVFGGGSSAIEVPDCSHDSFGPHITQEFDSTIDDHVFAFHSHIKGDNDRCIVFDRQRNEIKTNEHLNLTASENDFMTLSWNFKLDEKFQPPYSFCHIHQLKAVGGDDSMPIITITPRKSIPDELQLLQYDSKGVLIFLETVPLAPFLGQWIHASAKVTFGHNGTYDIQLTRWSDGEVLLTYSSENIDFWRNDTNFVRPKWGIYRSVQEAVLSRDEKVLFHDFCVGMGTDDMCSVNHSSIIRTDSIMLPLMTIFMYILSCVLKM